MYRSVTQVKSGSGSRTFPVATPTGGKVPGPVFRQCCGQRECAGGFDAPAMDFERQFCSRTRPPDQNVGVERHLLQIARNECRLARRKSDERNRNVEFACVR